MKKWILRTLIVLLVIGLVGGGIYLVVNKLSTNLPAASGRTGHGQFPGNGQGLPGDGQTPPGLTRPDDGQGFPGEGHGLKNGFGRDGLRGGSGWLEVLKDVLIVAATVGVVLLVQLILRRARRKARPAPAATAPMDVIPAAQPADAAPVDAAPAPEAETPQDETPPVQ